MNSIHAPYVNADVVLARRKGTRKIRITIKHDGTVRLTVPYGVSDQQAIQFLEDKAAWVNQHIVPKQRIEQGQHIGKGHRVYFEPHESHTLRTRFKANEIIILYPSNLTIDDERIQAKARDAVKKALVAEARNLLPARLEVLAKKFAVEYKDCTAKTLQTRWGSCDSNKHITLNAYLVQLDWKLIDYVIIHELAHTIHHHHQASFWTLVETMMPDYKERRKELKTFHTQIIPTFL